MNRIHRGGGIARPTPLSVWAPHAETLSLHWRPAGEGDLIEIPAERGEGGWWTPLGDPEVPGEIDYAYRIDGAGPDLPDPRSRFQPEGVHGPSRTVHRGSSAPRARSWQGRSWDGSAVYELHLGTFTPEGTLDSAIERLDHLVELGVGFVELMPVNAVNGTWNWGYDGVLWHAVHHALGGPEAYVRFVDAAHARGLGVLQDVVFNHLGPSGNYLERFGPYLHEASANTWGKSVNLDGRDSDEVRAYILDTLVMFAAEYGVDGFRLDAVHALLDSRALPILEEMALEAAELTEELGRPITLIAESDRNDPATITALAAGGTGLDAQWSDDLHHGLHVALTGETSGYYADFAPFSALAKGLERGFFHDGSYSSFRGRHHGRPVPEQTLAHRLVVSAQTHDQVGNRAAGDRLSQSLPPERLAVAATVLLLGPGTPMLFMGEEFAAQTPFPFFTSHPEDWLARATSEGRVEEFSRHGWDVSTMPDPQDPATFTSAKLDWSEPGTGTGALLLALHRRLLEIRAARIVGAAITLGDVAVEFSAEERWLELRLPALRVIASFSDAGARRPRGEDEILLDTSAELGGAAALAADGELHLPGWTAVVLG